jgi:hypothetical protein
MMSRNIILVVMYHQYKLLDPVITFSFERKGGRKEGRGKE